ncbi:MAG: hypothetical protein V3R64_08515, partial [Sphingomonadales bacterium]
MKKPFPREWTKLKYKDPEEWLIKSLEIRAEFAQTDFPEDIRNLRTNRLKRELEFWQICLFLYGMGLRLPGSKVFVARDENQDRDFIAYFQKGDTEY